MDITYNEFEILTCIEKENRELSQREISKATNLSLGTVNKTITNLLERKLINEDNLITKEGKTRSARYLKTDYFASLL